MSGRFYFKSDKNKLAQQFGVDNPIDTKSSHNITPSSKGLLVINSHLS